MPTTTTSRLFLEGVNEPVVKALVVYPDDKYELLNALLSASDFCGSVSSAALAKSVSAVRI